MTSIALPEYISVILDTLRQNGFESYVVGGCVRDFVMGNVPHDFDVNTSATPENVKECFRDFRVIETGLRHGTVTVVSGGVNVEITTFRVDGEYKDRRRPESVTFTDSLAADLSRRDFTVNAMAYSPHSGLVDLFDGRKHIQSKLIVCVGEADRRFSEDGLRIMRALRFASVLGFSIEAQTDLSIRRLGHLLKSISSERLYSEFTKLLCGRDAGRVLREYREVIFEFIPELASHTDLETAIKTLEASPAQTVPRLTALFLNIATEREGCVEAAQGVLRRLRADNRTLRAVCSLTHSFGEPPAPDEGRLRRLLGEKSDEWALTLTALLRADVLARLSPDERADALVEVDETERVIRQIAAEGSGLSLGTLALRGDDLAAMGIAPGREMGRLLDSLLLAVERGQAQNSRESLTNFLQSISRKDEE